MKKSIIIYSVLLLLVFIFHWFFSEIYCILTPFALVFIYPVILIMIAVMLIVSIILFVKKCKIFRWKAAVPLISVILTIAVLLLFPFEKVKVLTEFILYTPRREKLINMLDSDPSFEDVMYGNVTLPFGYRHLSCDGNIYVEKHTEDTLVIGFWVFRGLSVNGYSMVYYTSTQKESTLQNLIEDDISTIMKLNSKWYYVVTE